MLQRPMESNEAFADRKQLWSIGLATVRPASFRKPILLWSTLHWNFWIIYKPYWKVLFFSLWNIVWTDIYCFLYIIWMLASRCTFAEWQRLTEIYPAHYLTSSQGQKLHDLALQGCHFWLAAAWEAYNQGKQRWAVIPKLHLFHHMALDCKRWRYNCRAHHCFSGEDYMGYLKSVVQATSTGPKMEERTLKRALLKVVAKAPAEVSNFAARKWGKIMWTPFELHQDVTSHNQFHDLWIHTSRTGSSPEGWFRTC